MSRSAFSQPATLNPAIWCYLFYGGDEAGSREHAASIANAMGPDAERVDLAPSQLRTDPALLADEAASSSLFGTRRYIRVDGVGDESLTAIDGLLTMAAVVNPVVLIGGALRKDARLVKRLEHDPHGSVIASYPPSLEDLAKLAVTVAANVFLIIDKEVGLRLAATSGGDRAVMMREIEKLSDYANASVTARQTVTPAMLAAVGADAVDADLGSAVDATLRGDQRGLEAALTQIPDDDAIALIRAVQRRLIAMTAIRAEIDRGTPIRAATEKAGRSLFWKDRETIGRDIGHWPARVLARALELSLETERELKSSRGAGAVVLHRTLNTFARSVRR